MFNILISSTADVDFDGATPLGGQFFSGQSAGASLTFLININNDVIFEKDEYFYVSLDASDDVDIHIQTLTVFILDNDSELDILILK